MEHHANLVPWLLLKAERGIELRYLPRHRRRARSTLADLDRAARRRVKLVGVHRACRTCSAPSTPSRRIADGRPRGRCAGRWSTPPSRSRTCRSTCSRSAADFVGFTGHKMLGPTGIGCLWAPRGAARRDAALPRRRRDDPRRPPRRLHAATSCRGSSRPAPRRSPRRSGCGAAIDYLERRRHGRRPPARDRPHRLRPRRAHGALRRRPHDLRAPPTRAARRGRSPSPSRTSTPTTCPRCSTRPACASGPATIAPSR